MGAVTRAIHYVKARSDVNGNPRRGWELNYRDDRGRMVQKFFVDEGCEGSAPFFRAFPHFGRMFDPTTAFPVEPISASEYRGLLHCAITDRAPLVPKEERCTRCVAGEPTTAHYAYSFDGQADHAHD